MTYQQFVIDEMSYNYLNATILSMIRIIQIIVIFLNLVLAFFVLSQNTKSVNNRAFSLMSFIAALWAFSNYMDDFSTSLLWMQSSYAMGVLVISTGLIWTSSITKNAFELKKHLPLIIMALFFCIGSFFPNFIVESYYKDSLGAIPFGDPGFGLILYAIFYLLVSFTIVWKLYKAMVNATDNLTRSQFRNIYYGAIITLVITLFSSFILPFFSIFPFGAVDNAGFLIFLLFIAYSITKHRLFNIRVIAIEIVTFAIWITLLIRIFTAQTQQDLFVSLGLLITTIIFGILLIRSTINEILQLEHIDKLTEELRKTYASVHQLNDALDRRIAVQMEEKSTVDKVWRGTDQKDSSTAQSLGN